MLTDWGIYGFNNNVPVMWVTKCYGGLMNYKYQGNIFHNKNLNYKIKSLVYNNLWLFKLL